MTAASVRIGVLEDARGFLVSLPAQFWLVVGLRKTFPNVQAALEPWTYRVPPSRRRCVELEAWIAEVELQARAEARRRSWTATDAEWLGAGEPQAPLPMPAEPAVVTLPRKRTARAVLNLLVDLTGSTVLVVTVGADGGREFRLAPSGRRVRTAVAERAIAARLIVPGNDGLLGPEWSQTWRGPTPEETHAAAQRGGEERPTHDRKRSHRAAGSLPGAEAGGVRGSARPRKKRPVLADGSRHAAPRGSRSDAPLHDL